METITKRFYKCDLCGFEYKFYNDALNCELKPIKEIWLIKPGDKVKILNGDDEGKVVTVEKTFICHRYYLPHSEKAWHTVGLIVDMGNCFKRNLIFDEYIPA